MYNRGGGGEGQVGRQTQTRAQIKSNSSPTGEGQIGLAGLGQNCHPQF